MPVTLRGKVTRVFYCNPDRPFTTGVLVGEEGEARFAGKLCAEPGALVELVGEWVDDPKWGRQFKADGATVKMDESADALAHLLATGDDFRGLGRVRARRLVDAALELGADLSDALQSHAEAIAARSGVPLEIVENARRVWLEKRRHFETLAALIDQGWTNGQAATILHYLGDLAPHQVKADPYALIGKIPRFGFRTVDAVALKMGTPKNDPRRMQSGVAYCLDQIASNGDTWTTRDGLLDSAVQELRPDTLEAEDLIFGALDELIALGMVHKDTSPTGNEIVADAHIAAMEIEVFDRLRSGLGTPLRTLEYAGPRASAALAQLNEGQRSACMAVLHWAVSVMSGAGGVGKTFTVRAVCDIAEENKLRVGLCAPTGKASRKLSHSARRPASTIHRLLEPVFDETTGKFRFLRDANNPLELDLVIVDEISMADIKLMRSLLSALPSTCRLLLVGDHNQIPPVGAGAILRDLLSARMHFPEAINVLTQIVRQAGELARNTTAILSGFVPSQSPGSVVWQIHNVDRGHEDGCAALAAMIVDMIVSALEPLQPFGRKLDLEFDVQVLAPQRKGRMGTYALNVHLQKLRQRMLGNPEPEATEHDKAPKPLLGDRVIWTKNDYELNLFNGTQAIVADFPKGGILLFTEDGREVLVPGDKRIHIEVAYAMTIHKSQGSEWPFVLLVASSAHWNMHDRNLLYTGASRAAESLMILGDKQGLAHFAQERKSETRQTLGSFLVHGWRPSLAVTQAVVAELE